jgi:hypothetical protein
MIAAVGVVAKIRLQKIGEKEDFQDNKHDEKFDQNDQPNLFSPFGHVGKSIAVKSYYFFEQFHPYEVKIQTSKVKLYFFKSSIFRKKIGK